MIDEAQDPSPDPIAAPLRNVTHGLANAVGLLKTVSGEFDKMSPDAAFLARGIVQRLGELLTECTAVYERVSHGSQDDAGEPT